MFHTLIQFVCFVVPNDVSAGNLIYSLEGWRFSSSIPFRIGNLENCDLVDFQHVMHVDIFNNYHVPRISSESIVHETEGRMDYLLRGHEGERNKIVLVKSNYLFKKISRQNIFL